MKKGTSHQDKMSRLKKIEGQIRGVQNMIEEKRYCVDILNTVSSVIGALKKVEEGILKDHIDSCVKKAFNGTSRREKEEKLEEVLSLLGKIRK